MLCNKCSDTPKTVADVLGCRTCQTDGTANEIPKDLTGAAPLEAAITRKPGLGNRFAPERPTPPSEDVLARGHSERKPRKPRKKPRA